MSRPGFSDEAQGSRAGVDVAGGVGDVGLVEVVLSRLECSGGAHDGRMGRIQGAGGVYRRCGCEDPASGRAVGGSCPRLARERSHGSWYLRLELGSGPGGSRRRVRRGGFPTRKAAEEELRRLRGPTGGRLTVAEWLARWL